MAVNDSLGIKVVIDPTATRPGLAAVEAGLEQTRRKGADVGGSISRSLRLSIDQPMAQLKKLQAEMDAVSRHGKGLSVSIGGTSTFQGLSAGLDASRIASARTELDQFIGKNNEAARSASLLASNVEKVGFVSRVTSSALGKVGIAAAAAFAAKKVIDYSDAYTNLQNRLVNVTEGSEDLANVTARLFKLSDDTRSSFTATGEFYARLATSTKELGLTQNDVFEFTESLTKAIKVSGAAAQESQAAMIQLSQGLASGTLRGDELRSVLEQLPAVADVIAKGLGVTRGKLRELGAEGKITSKQIIDAFAEQKDAIDAKFANTVPTFGDMLVRLENMFVRFAGRMQPILAPIVGFFGDLIDVVGVVLETVAPAFDLIGNALSAAMAIVGPVISLLKDALGLIGSIIGGIASAVSAAGGLLQDLAGGSVNAFAKSKEFKEFVAAEQKKEKAAHDERMEALRAEARGMDEAARAAKLFNLESGKKVGFDVNESEIQALKEVTAEFENLKITALETITGVNASMGTLPGTIANIKIKQLTEDFAAFQALGLQAFPAQTALIELATAQDQVNRLVEQGVITDEQAVEVMRAKTRAVDDQLGNADSIIRKLNEETQAIRQSLQPRGEELELIRLKNQAMAQGEPLTEAEEKAITAAYNANKKAKEALDEHTSARKRHTSATDDLLKRLQALIDETHPVEAAFRELQAAEDLLERAVKKGKIAQDEAIDTLERKRRAMQDQLDPAGVVIRKLHEEIDAYRVLTTAQKASLEAQKAEAELLQRNILLTEEQRQAIQRLTLAKAKLAAGEKPDVGRAANDNLGIVTQTVGGVSFQARERTLTEAIEQDSARRSAAVEAWSRITQESLERNNENIVRAAEVWRRTTLEGGFVEGIEGIRASTENLGLFIADKLIGVFDTLSATLAKMVVEGTYSLSTLREAFHEFAQAAIAELINIAVRAALLQALGLAVGVPSAPSAGLGLPPGLTQQIPGFASGGSFDVGGNGGTDSQLVAFRATPGEHVEVRTPAQRDDGPRYTPPPVSNNNEVDPESFLRLLETPRASRSVRNTIRLHTRAIKRAAR